MKIGTIDDILKETMINKSTYFNNRINFEEKANFFNEIIQKYSTAILEDTIKLPFNNPDKIKQIVGKTVQINDFKDAITSADFLQEEILSEYNESKFVSKLIEKNKLIVFNINISQELNDFIDNLEEKGNLCFIKRDYGYLPLPFVEVDNNIYSFDDIFMELNAGLDIKLEIPEVYENSSGELIINYKTQICDLKTLGLTTEYFINNGLKEYYNDVIIREKEKTEQEIETEINEYYA